MTLLKAVVREVALDGGALTEEAFLEEGVGSAFVSRPNVLVVVSATDRGIAQLPKKFEQLIGRGFHHVVLTLPGVDRLAGDAWSHLKGALAYADQFAGWVCLCGVSPALRAAIEAAATKDGADDIVRFAGDRDEAVAAFRRLQQDDDGVDPLAVESGDTLGSADTTGSDDDWGGDWGGASTPAKDSGRLPRVDTVEMLVEADELGTLRDRVQAAIKKGKKYFTVRLHFRRDRRVTTEDMRALAGARDLAVKAGGQVVLAALQEELSKWLRLLGEDRHFTIAETADEAEQLHRRHSAGELPAVTPPRAGEPPFVILSKDSRAIVIRPSATRARTTVKPTTAALRVIVLGREGLAALSQRVKRLAAEGVHDIVADLSKFKEIRGESFDQLPRALELAGKLEVRLAFGGVAREVRALLKILGVPDGGDAGRSAIGETIEGAALLLAAARPAFEELRLDLTTETLDEAPPLDPVSSIDLDEPALDGHELPLTGPSQAEVASLRAEVASLRAEVATAQSALQRAQAERDQAKRKAQEAEAERDQARRKAQEAEQQRERADQVEKKLAELQRRLDEAQRALADTQRSAEEQRGSTQQDVSRLARDLEMRRTRIAELELALQQGDAQVDEVKLGAEGKVRELELELEGARDRAQELEAEGFRAKQLEQTIAARDERVAALEARERELAAAVEQAQATQRDQGARAASDAAARVRELEAALADRDRQVQALQDEVVTTRTAAAAAAPAPGGGGGGGDEGLRQRVADLERENAQVLTEAEREIQRLMREQKQLREELESAGEMIERLGKELEYS